MGRQWALAAISVALTGATLPEKFSFDIGRASPGLKLVDCAATADLLYCRFAGGGRSEIRVFDFAGRAIESTAQKLPAESPFEIATGRLPVWEDDPVLLVPVAKDSLVIIQVFSGIFRRVGLDGVVRTQRTMSGPGLDEFRATLGEGEGLFSPSTATDDSGFYVVLGRSSPTAGAAIQKYDFDGNFVRELRLPFLCVSKLIVRNDTLYVVDFLDRRVVAFGLSIP
jgi:hypothetical protein